MPSNERINRALAIQFGWGSEQDRRYVKDDYFILEQWYAPDGRKHPHPPDFCTDRNLLPVIWQQMKDRCCMSSYMSALCSRFPRVNTHIDDYIAIHTADPRECALAAMEVLASEFYHKLMREEPEP